MPSVTTQELEQTATHWGETYQSENFARREWIGHPLAWKRLRRIMNGHTTHTQWFVHEQMKRKPARRALGIGVGAAFHENQLVAVGAAEHYDYYDVAQAGLDMARAEAEKLGIADKISFICADINTVELPAEGYDLVTFMASLHHIHELEKTLLACERALAPGGVLWAFEYVGPDRFAYPDEHADIARRLFRILDADIRLPGEPELKFPSPEDVIAVDPTEAVHSSQILPTLRRIWPDLEVYGQYGSLSSMMMWCLNHDALYDTTKGFEAYGTILDIEDALVDSGRLPHYFVNAIARKPTARQALAIRIGLDVNGDLYRGLQAGRDRLHRHVRQLVQRPRGLFPR